MPTFTVPFILSFIYNLFLYKRIHLESTIFEHQLLGAHTDVICFEYSREKRSTMVTKYVWSHSGLRPYGQILETQCSNCKGLRTWVQKGPVHEGQVSLKCKGAKCTAEREFSMLADVAFIRNGNREDERGTWMKLIL